MLQKIALVGFATVLVGCGTPGAVARRPLESVEIPGKSKPPARVDLLARQFLVRLEAPPSGYAYYCSLLFADKSEGRANSRRLAASAYLRLLSDVVDVRDLKNVRPENMALLMSFIKTYGAAQAVLKDRDVEVFLASYDYDRAQLLCSRLRRTGRDVPAVSIVGSRAPIEDMDPIEPRAVFIVSLDASTDGRFEAGIDELPHEGEPAVLRAMRKFFALVGESLEDLKKIPDGL